MAQGHALLGCCEDTRLGGDSATEGVDAIGVESFYDTTATAAGATGTCETFWYLTFTNAPYSPAVTSRSMKEVRCDNATAGRPLVGCVMPWAASDLVYTRTATPELADHVAKAQASGLPSRLTRTENQAIIDSNRTQACGSAPSVPNKSCDEYPIASSHQGLSAGERAAHNPAAVSPVSLRAPARRE
ncbi:hypothetical protein ACIA8H_22315 [Streptomyces goshikiensis]|uniref:hypothetical protein n=1 Tax=Streptomyces goshikiensis TaxID=1942 RepID=UPI0037A87C8B